MQNSKEQEVETTTHASKIRNINEYRQEYAKLEDFTDNIESLILEQGEFDVLRENFWQDLANAEISLSPDISPSIKFRKEGFAEDAYPRKLWALDAFHQ